MTDSIKLRAVLTGDEFMLEVQGGYVRRPVPSDGAVVATGSDEVFLPEEALREVLRQLDQKRLRRDGEEGGARKAPQRAEQLTLGSDKKSSNG